MKLRCLITGNKGFIGSHLEPKLKHHLMGWDIDTNQDIFDGFFENAVSNSDLVIHLAAITSVEQSQINPDKTFYTNVLGTGRVVTLCHKYRVKLIYPSTGAVFHPEVSPYAFSKRVAEDIVTSVMPYMDIVVLRMRNIYGPLLNQRSGSIIYQFLNQDPIEVYGDGQQTRDFIHIDDVVKIFLAALKPEWNRKIVDVGSGQPVTLQSVAEIFGKYRGVKVVNVKPKNTVVQKWPEADTTVLRQLYKDEFIPLEEGIRKLCQK